MLGLAVGIDYALFILSRHRQQLNDGMEPEESAGRDVSARSSRSCASNAARAPSGTSTTRPPRCSPRT